MSEKRFKKMDTIIDPFPIWDTVEEKGYNCTDTLDLLVDLLNKQQELIEELQTSDEMGWKRAEHFEKKCSKELHNKKMYIKRLEYKVQKFKEMNGEQQATINELEQENADLLGDNIRSLDEFEKCTNKLKAKILEQQSTIQRMKHSLNTIYKAFEKHYGYDMRNAVWLIDELSYDEIVDDEINNEIGFDSDE